MKTVLIAACAALALSACATGYGHDRYGFNAYYDDFYGPYGDGYWGRDGGFWYRRGPHDHYVRDSGNHFRRGPSNGFHGVHGGGGMFHRH